MQAHIHGTVVVDAIIDERGNVVQARAVSGHPLLIAAALRAVLQWKYEPTSLNGQPISVELQVLVNFR
jgi:protein TonB